MPGIVRPLTIDELEKGARLLDRGEVDCQAFWQMNDASFRSTLLLAFRETSEALSSEHVPPAFRHELERQVELLRQCIDADYRFVGRA